jgi:hypothetical protein
MNSRRPASALLAATAGLAVFFVLATANSAGYRYGASDLAFYAPAVIQQLDPRLFPRDSPLIHAQADLTLMDETVGAIARVTGASLPTLFIVLYTATLGLLALGGARLGGALFREPWAVAALVAALTLKHAIARSGTNTLESYFHPRQLAFAFGVLALGEFLRRRYFVMAALICGSASLHPTTTLWFVIWLWVALFACEPAWRRRLAMISAAGGVIAIWIVTLGPLAHRLRIMDPEWLAAIADKSYLFPLQWPFGVWALNLGYIVLVGAAYRARSAAGLLHERETALVAGGLALAAVFLASLPFNAARVALAIQLQPARIFWMLDLLALAYLVWMLAEGTRPRRSRAITAAALVLAFSAARGIYLMTVLFPARPLVQVNVPDDDWGRVMAWAAASDPASGWIADPLHAARHGTSVRVAGRRDVFVEALKDAALGMYDRNVAMRTRDRIAALSDFHVLTAERARELAATHRYDYLVAGHRLALPVAFESGTLRVYRLR